MTDYSARLGESGHELADDAFRFRIPVGRRSNRALSMIGGDHFSQRLGELRLEGVLVRDLRE